MHMSLLSAWFLSVPMVLIFAYIAIFHRATAKRMSDMTGYTTKEKAIAALASTAPYPFMILTAFTPLTSNTAAIVPGALFYVAGLAGFLFSVVGYTTSLPGKPAMHGIYKISRNPMYVSAFLIFSSIVVMTLNLLLAVLLIVIIILNHGMILSEEKACVKRFGKTYEHYIEKTPRYLFI